MNKKTMDQKAVRVCVIQFSVKNLKSVWPQMAIWFPVGFISFRRSPNNTW
jgi:hypothetical protein